MTFYLFNWAGDKWKTNIDFGSAAAGCYFCSILWTSSLPRRRSFDSSRSLVGEENLPDGRLKNLQNISLRSRNNLSRFLNDYKAYFLFTTIMMMTSHSTCEYVYPPKRNPSVFFVIILSIVMVKRLNQMLSRNTLFSQKKNNNNNKNHFNMKFRSWKSL